MITVGLISSTTRRTASIGRLRRSSTGIPASAAAAGRREAAYTLPRVVSLPDESSPEVPRRPRDEIGRFGHRAHCASRVGERCTSFRFGVRSGASTPTVENKRLIELGSHEDGQRREPEPQQQHNGSAEGAVGLVVSTKRRHVD